MGTDILEDALTLTPSQPDSLTESKAAYKRSGI